MTILEDFRRELRNILSGVIKERLNDDNHFIDRSRHAGCGEEEHQPTRI